MTIESRQDIVNVRCTLVSENMLNIRNNERFKEDPRDEYEDQENPNNLLGFTASKLCYPAV